MNSNCDANKFNIVILSVFAQLISYISWNTYTLWFFYGQFLEAFSGCNKVSLLLSGVHLLNIKRYTHLAFGKSHNYKKYTIYISSIPYGNQEKRQYIYWAYLFNLLIYQFINQNVWCTEFYWILFPHMTIQKSFVWLFSW